MSPILLIAAGWATLALAAPNEAQQALMSGRFVTVDPHEQVQAMVDAAVERAAAEFSWAIRGYARRKLAEGATWCPDVRFALAAETWSAECTGSDVLIRRLDGSEGPVTLADGRVFDTDIRLVDDRTLVVDYQGDNGTRHVTYRYRDDGGLQLTVEVQSPHLSTPMTWTIGYRRAE